jgi:hypothetical protein
MGFEDLSPGRWEMIRAAMESGDGDVVQTLMRPPTPVTLASPADVRAEQSMASALQRKVMTGAISVEIGGWEYAAARAAAAEYGLTWAAYAAGTKLSLPAKRHTSRIAAQRAQVLAQTQTSKVAQTERRLGVARRTGASPLAVKSAEAAAQHARAVLTRATLEATRTARALERATSAVRLDEKCSATS